MSNPVHPKVLGGFAGVLGGGGIGALISDLLSHSSYYQHLTATNQQALVGLIVVGLAAVGQFIVGYLSKWEPAVGKVAAAIEADVFPEAPLADDSAPAVTAEAPQAVDDAPAVPPAV